LSPDPPPQNNHSVLGGNRKFDLATMNPTEMSEFYLKAKAMQKTHGKYRGQGKKKAAASSAAAIANAAMDLASVSGSASTTSAKGGKGPRRRRSFTDNRPGSASATEYFGGSPGAPQPNSKAVRKALAQVEMRTGLGDLADAVRSRPSAKVRGAGMHAFPVCSVDARGRPSWSHSPPPPPPPP